MQSPPRQISARLIRALRAADWLDRSRLLAYAAILGAFEIALALFWIIGAHDNLDPTGKPLGTDFISFWSASHLGLQGTPELAYVPAIHGAVEASQVGGAAVGYFAFFYPPPFLVVCLPLALLPYAVSLGVWLVATAAPFLIALRRMLVGLSAIEFVACLAFPAIVLNIGHGQNGFLTAALVASAFLVLPRRPVLAGALLGCLVVKPQLAVLVPFILASGGHWRAFWSAGATAALLVLASWLLLGGESWSAFLAALVLAQETLSESLVEPAKMVTVYAAARLLHMPSTLALALQAIATVAVVVVVARHARHANAPMLAALFVCGTLLATPFALDYDLTLLAIPLAALFAAGRQDSFLPYEKIVLLVAFVLPLAVRPFGMGLGLPVAPLVVGGLLWLVTRRLPRPAAGTSSGR